MPALESVLCGVTQLVNGLGDSLTEFDLELDCSDSIFVGIHELLSGSPRIPPHPHWLSFRSAPTTVGYKAGLALSVEQMCDHLSVTEHHLRFERLLQSVSLPLSR